MGLHQEPTQGESDYRHDEHESHGITVVDLINDRVEETDGVMRGPAAGRSST